MRALAASISILLLAGCGGPEPDGSGRPELEGFTLRPDDAPEGLELASQGPIESFREVLPPRTAAPGLPPLGTEVRRAFLGGYEAVYRGRREGGLSSAASSVLRFSDSGAAAAFLEHLRGIQAAEVAVGSSRMDTELLEAPAIGDLAYAWHRVTPGAETSGCSWQHDDLVLTITLGGAIGRAPAAASLDLARTVDAGLR